MVQALVQVPERLHARADIVAKSWNPETRTIDVVFTTGYKGLRYDWRREEFYYEELGVDQASIRLDRLNNGAAVLDTHGQFTLEDQFGVVERAWIDPGKGMATLRFSKREDVQGIVGDIIDGIIRNISVGYKVHKYVDVTLPDDAMRTIRAVDWEPCEISFVPVPFDPGAQARSDGTVVKPERPARLIDVELITNRSAEPERQTQGAESMTTPAQGTQPETKVDLVAERKAAVEAERARSNGIQEITRKLGLDASFGAKHVNEGTELEAFRTVAIDAKAAVDEKSNTRTQNGRIAAGEQDEHVVRAAGMTENLIHRWNPKAQTLGDNGRRFVGLSLVEMARRHLEGHGIRTEGMGRHEIASKALTFRSGSMSTSDFPYVLANVANKALLTGFQQIEAKQTFAPIARKAYTPDFKQVSRVRRGEAPSLVLVPEGAEITQGSFGESRETYQIATYARIVKVTEEMIVNDDLNAFTKMPSDMGAAAARLESDVAWNQITSNPTMGDSVALFHATHGNLGTTGAISITTIAELEALMGLQTGIDDAMLDIAPRYLIVPVTLKSLAVQFVSEKYLASEAGKINPYAGRLEVIAEPRLDAAVGGTADWYLAASPDDGVDVLETLYLEGTNGPVTAMEDAFTSNGMSVRVKHYFAAKVLDWRGLAANK